MTWLLLILGALGLLWVFGPRERVDLTVRFDPAELGDDVDAYFAQQEARLEDITPGTQKRVIWTGKPGAKMDIAVLYVHGFSATSEEIRPVPDNVAQALGANLVFTRLAGHGRSSAAMAEPTAADWMHDTAEALAAARAVGKRVIVISTSTGCTLMAAAAFREDLMDSVDGIIFVSPNFKINNPAAALLTMPAVRWWGPLIAGRSRSFDVANEDHETYWTTTYPTVAALPMAALVKAVDRLDLSQTKVPALFMMSDEDKVVSPVKTRQVAQDWGGPTNLDAFTLGEGDDPNRHVIAGDILSPGQTEWASTLMIAWSKHILSS